MGTCFTKTHYINGRQRNRSWPLNRHESESRRKLESDVLSQIPNYQALTGKSVSQHGKDSVQSTYNRWISRKQNLHSQSIDQEFRSHLRSSSEISSGNCTYLNQVKP